MGNKIMLSQGTIKMLSNRFVLDALRKLLLSQCFESTYIYTVFHENAFEINSDKEKDGCLRDLETEKIRKRVIRLSNRLSCTNLPAEEPVGNPLWFPKIYDSILQESMVKTYNNVVAEPLNIPKIHTIVTKKWLERGFENIEPMDNSVITPYGYTLDIFSEKRSKLTLSEIVMYAGLCLTTRSRAVNTLNKQVESAVDRRRAQKWFERYRACIRSENMHDAILRCIVSFIKEDVFRPYKKIREAHLREFWLDEKYKNRKDSEKALIAQKNYDIHYETDAKLLEGIEQLGEINTIEVLCGEILPLAEFISLGVIPKDVRFITIEENHVDGRKIKEEKETDTIDMISFLRKAPKPYSIDNKVYGDISYKYMVYKGYYKMAIEVAEYIDVLIDAIIAEVGKILSCLLEASIIEQGNVSDFLLTDKN